jgi:hypothetical protein
MHWRTFERLTAEHDTLVEHSLTGMMQWLKRLNLRADNLLEKFE